MLACVAEQAILLPAHGQPEGDRPAGERGIRGVGEGAILGGDGGTQPPVAPLAHLRVQLLPASCPEQPVQQRVRAPRGVVRDQ